jgi:hypothetical protein
MFQPKGNRERQIPALCRQLHVGLEGFLQPFEGHISLSGLEAGEQVLAGSMQRLRCQQPLQALDGSGAVTLRHVHAGCNVQNFDGVRSPLQRHPQHRLRPRVVAEFQAGRSELRKTCRGFLAVMQRFLETRNRLCDPPKPTQGESTAELRAAAVGPDKQGLGKRRLTFLPMASLEHHLAQQLKGVGIGWSLLEALTEQARALIELSGVHELACHLHRVAGRDRAQHAMPRARSSDTN